MLMLSTISCFKPTTETSDSTVKSSDTTNTLETTDPNYDKNGYWKDDIPDDLKFTGQTVTILAWNDVEHEEFNPESDTGDPVNDSLVARNRTVEERLGITLEFDRSQDGNSANTSAWKTYVGTQVKVGSNFDIMAGYSLSVATCAAAGYNYNLLDEECSYLNFDQPWWPDSLIDLATVHDKLYFASGDISTNALYMMYVCFVNDSIIENHGLTSPSVLVDQNEWTYDKFIEMCEGIYVDNNGNQLKDVGDIFGYMTSGIHTDPWFYGCGGLFVDKDENGDLIVSPTLSGDEGEKVLDTFTKINKLLWDSSDGIYTTNVNHQIEFANGNLLFATDRCRIAITQLNTNIDLDYSIVPVPKYDSDQENYITLMGNPFTLYTMPSDCQNPEMCSAVIEVYASEGYRQVTPALFETTLKIKYVSDEISSRMYDIIRENLCFDLGRIHSTDLISQSTIKNIYINNAAASWTTAAISATRSLEARLDILKQIYE